jgi:hypothetical protein
VIFGLLHAAYLSANHAWRIAGPKRGQPRWIDAVWTIALTYACVLLGQVFFRASSTSDAIRLLGSLAGGGGEMPFHSVGSIVTIARIALCMAICLLLPNSQQLTRDYRPVLDPVANPPLFRALVWRPNILWGLALGGLLLAALLRMSDTSKFLYFQF